MLLCAQSGYLRLHKMLGISLLGGTLLAFQDRLCSMELVGWLVCVLCLFVFQRLKLYLSSNRCMTNELERAQKAAVVA
jgi:hypothetical protein